MNKLETIYATMNPQQRTKFKKVMDGLLNKQATDSLISPSRRLRKLRIDIMKEFSGSPDQSTK